MVIKRPLGEVSLPLPLYPTFYDLVLEASKLSA